MTSPDTQTKAGVVIVEDHPMFRERLAHLINKEPDMMVSGEADNIDDAMAIIREKKPQIAIVDITLRGSSGIELIKDLKASALDVQILVLSMHDESLYAERVLRAGAKGYITKHEASEKVMVALRRVLGGEIYVSETITAKILKNLADGGSLESPAISRLTDRELEVFQLIGHGRTTREIAETLNLGATTVDTYRARIKEKLALKNATELQHRAAQWVKEQE